MEKGKKSVMYTARASVTVYEGENGAKPLSEANERLYETADELKKLPGVSMAGSPKSRMLCLSKLNRDVEDDRWAVIVFALPVFGGGLWMVHHFEKNGEYMESSVFVPGARIARDENNEPYPTCDEKTPGTVEKKR